LIFTSALCGRTEVTLPARQDIGDEVGALSGV
jgi:hypothetical protein